jgi:hypothetical protein
LTEYIKNAAGLGAVCGTAAMHNDESDTDHERFDSGLPIEGIKVGRTSALVSAHSRNRGLRIPASIAGPALRLLRLVREEAGRACGATRNGSAEERTDGTNCVSVKAAKKAVQASGRDASGIQFHRNRARGPTNDPQRGQLDWPGAGFADPVSQSKQRLPPSVACWDGNESQ